MLSLATDADQRARDAVTFAEWGTQLTQKQFLSRELLLRRTPWAQASMRTWLWRRTDGVVLSSCETFRSQATLAGRPAVVESVASVFTEPHLRGRGAAQAMMDSLCERLRHEGTDAVLLYSDIGPTLYQRCGFEALEAGDTVWEPQAIRPAATWSTRLEPLPHGEFSGALQVTPTVSQLAWHLARESFYRDTFGRLPLLQRGARYGQHSMVWAGDEKANELVVLWASAPEPALFSAASSAAHDAGYRRVRAWGPWPGGTLVARDGSLPMVRWFVPRPADGWVNVQRGLWV